MSSNKTKEILERFNKLGIHIWSNSPQKNGKVIVDSKDSIPSGSYQLDKALGANGWPKGKIIEIFGSDSSGKSTLALHAVAEAQKQGKTCVYIDLENTLNVSWAEKIGVQTNNLYICTPSSGEETFEVIGTLIQDQGADLIIVDSVAAMVPEAELDASLSDQSMGLQARLMSKGLRIIQSHLLKSHTTIIFINQIREQIKQTFFPSTTTTGGRALKYAASIRVEVRKQEAIKQGEKIIGYLTKITIVKNKFNNPMIQIPLGLYFDAGFNKFFELINLAIEKKIIEKRGAWFYYKDKNLGQGIFSLKEKFQSEEMQKELEEIKTAVLGAE
ncbi:recombinase RecA [Mycoplasma suis]|uniref:Protein RecA n=2 Tax=Mycoplasma suis TaxID=57372 RepID=F0QS81_MYCSL|nr:recombinase RecA [Mycoplasma suis]ADX98351.1 recombinase A [Mycoplasma suis str. Illinois]CBZ40860.1 RecA recombinase [Mycoplasma suis KI3806]